MEDAMWYSRLTTGLGFEHEDKGKQCGTYGARRECGSLFHNWGAACRKERFVILRRDWDGRWRRVIKDEDRVDRGDWMVMTRGVDLWWRLEGLKLYFSFCLLFSFSFPFPSLSLEVGSLIGALAKYWWGPGPRGPRIDAPGDDVAEIMGTGEASMSWKWLCIQCIQWSILENHC